MDKKYKLGYCGIVGDFFNKATYLRMKQCSELCCQFVIGIPDEYVMARLLGDSKPYSAKEVRQIWLDCKWVDDIIILDTTKLSKQKVYEELHFDVCFYGSEYGKAYEEDVAFMKEKDIDFISLIPETIQPRRECDALGLALKNVRPEQKIVLFGTGEYFDYYMKNYGTKYIPAYAIDDLEERWDTDKDGVLIKSPSALQEEVQENIFIVICGEKRQEQIKRIRQIGAYDYRTFLAYNEAALLEEFSLAWKGEQEYIARVHEVLPELLREFARVCAKYGLRYYVIYGTLIGVIRHRDIIPWDDDVDIAMPREDFEKLKEIAPNEWNNDEFLLLNYDEFGNNAFLDFVPRLLHLHESFPVKVFDKVENKATVDVKGMMWIDIQILDNASSNIKKHIFFTNVMKMLYGLCMGHRGKIDYSDYERRLSKNKMFMLKTAHRIGRCLPFKMLILLYERLSKYSINEECEDYFIGNAPIHYIQRRFKKAYFGEGILKPFRDFEVMVPSDYDGLLNAMGYSNYMSFPRMSVRKPSHYFNSDISLW